jgi:hypothetical protein
MLSNSVLLRGNGGGSGRAGNSKLRLQARGADAAGERMVDELVEKFGPKAD